MCEVCSNVLCQEGTTHKQSRLLDKRGSWVTMSSGSWRRPSLRASWCDGDKIMITASFSHGWGGKKETCLEGVGYVTAYCLTTGDGGSHVIGSWR